MYAAAWGDIQQMDQLLIEGDINSQDKFGSTPHKWATRYQQEKMVQYLLEKGANSLIADQLGNFPLFISMINGYQKIQEILYQNMTELEIKSLQNYFNIFGDIWMNEGLYSGK